MRPLVLIAALLIAVPASTQTPSRSRVNDPTRAELEAASRFLSRATLGVPYDEIVRTARVGPGRWLDEQFAEPPSYQLPLTRQLREIVGERGEELLPPIFYHRIAWWQQTMTGNDILRRRVATALSEIFVVSENVDLLAVNPEGVSSYYDMLLDNAFGNFRELLLDVTLHPAMGFYLSHLNNDRGDPSIGRFPDENYAREVMQLFSIGLFELNPDGTQKLDSQGRPIPTYTNREITELAKVFTGLGSGGAFGRFGALETIDLTVPMRMYDEHHEPGPKRLLNGFVVPAGQSGAKDVADAVDHLFAHPNVGPFIARLLIQRLATSNPSPAYIERVAAAFADNGRGVRGDMKAVIRAVLLDPEVRQKPSEPTFGHLQEPFVRYVKIARIFNATTPTGVFMNSGSFADFFLRQHVMASPSVFNFFSPDHQPPGVLAENGLVAPEMEITTTSTVLNMANLVDLISLAGAVMFNIVEHQVEECAEGECDVEPKACEDLPPGDESDCLPRAFYAFDATRAALDLGIEEELAARDVGALLDRLDLLLTYGTLSDGSREIIREMIDPYPPFFRVRFALYLILISPDFVVSD